MWDKAQVCQTGHIRDGTIRERGGVGLPRVEVLETAAVDKKGDPSGS